jgi:hypothetical protein
MENLKFSMDYFANSVNEICKYAVFEGNNDRTRATTLERYFPMVQRRISSSLSVIAMRVSLIRESDRTIARLICDHVYRKIRGVLLTATST